MPRRSRPTSRNVPQTRPKAQPQTPSTVNVQGPGIADSIKTGFGFGVGSAVAHSTVDAILGSNKNPQNSVNQDQVEGQKDMCGQIFMKYIDCVQKYDKYDSTCSEINDFLVQMKCKNQSQSM